MKNQIRSSVALCVGSLIAGCTAAPQAKLQTATDKFATSIDTASSIVLLQANSEPAHRRRAAIIYLMSNPADTSSIDPTRLEQSFARYVCTGSAAFYREGAFIDYAKKYAKTLRTLTAAPKAGLAEEWARTRAIRNSRLEAQAAPPQTAEEASMACTKEVVDRDLAYKGLSLNDFSNESVAGLIGGYEAIKTLFEAAKGLATAGLKTVNDVEARRRFTVLVTGQHETFLQNLAAGLPPERLNGSWQARRGDALWPAYQTFQQLLLAARAPVPAGNGAALDRRQEVWKLQERLQEQLNVYDTLRAATPPGEVQVAIAKAEQQLLDLAQNKDVSIDDLIAFLDLVIGDLKEVEKQYDAVRKAAKLDA